MLYKKLYEKIIKLIIDKACRGILYYIGFTKKSIHKKSLKNLNKKCTAVCGTNMETQFLFVPFLYMFVLFTSL